MDCSRMDSRRVGAKDPEFRGQEREFDLLIRLSKATRLLKTCSPEHAKEILRDLQVKSYLGKPKVSQTSVKDEDLCPMDFLVLLLESHSKVVAHAAFKTLLALSMPLRKSRSAWAPFLLCLWTVAKHWATATSSRCCGIAEGEKGPGQMSDIETCENKSNARVQRMDWLLIMDATVPSLGQKNLSAASYAIQILQRILKEYVKDSFKGLEDLETFLLLFTDNILGVATATCFTRALSRSSNYVRPLKQQKHAEEVEICCLCSESSSGHLSRDLLLGSLLRLLCTASLVASRSKLNPPSVCETLANDTFLKTMENLILVISPSVLAPHMKCMNKNCIQTFLSYKFLMFMMRLAECFEGRPSLASSCLNGFHSYGTNLLGFNLQDPAASEANSLDDTPFATSLVHGLQGTKASATHTSFKHLQRRALYILFKIASTSLNSLWKPSNTAFVGQAVIVPGTEHHKQGEEILGLNQLVMQTLIEWLNQQAHPATVTNGVAGCIQNCDLLGHLAKSLVQFYLDEDDLMLKMLLLFVNQPSLSTIIALDESNNSGRWKVAALAFSAERIFHSFLAAIRYSSSVLVDFLISEESGTLCLLYLMRSIQCITASWPEFVISAPCASENGQTLQTQEVSTPISIHTLQGGTMCPPNISSTSNKRLGEELDQSDSFCQSKTVTHENWKGEWIYLEVESNTRSDEGNLDGGYCDARNSSQIAKRAVVTKAADCLLQLKLSIERLNRRSLFPYNPSALLRRFESAMEHLGEFLTQ